VDLLQRHAGATLDEKSHRWLGLVSDSAKDMGQLIDDLLVFSRMGRSEMLRADCDLRHIVDEVVAGLMSNSNGRAVKWSVHDLPVVRGDATMLRLAMQNLLGNAFKYTQYRDPARIEVSGSTSVEEWVITVRDNGVGFDMKYADKLFGVFQRLHSAKEFEGTGIGLANVHRIVQRHGGRVWAEGEVGKGAAFHFSLPRAR
jgi:light-regulated signal transduction histidine kinase (bacteriophytochrome)